MKINRNLVANALLIATLAGGAVTTATANTQKTQNSSKATRSTSSSTTEYTLNITRVTGEAPTVLTGTGNGSQ